MSDTKKILTNDLEIKGHEIQHPLFNLKKKTNKRTPNKHQIKNQPNKKSNKKPPNQPTTATPQTKPENYGRSLGTLYVILSFTLTIGYTEAMSFSVQEVFQIPNGDNCAFCYTGIKAAPLISTSLAVIYTAALHLQLSVTLNIRRPYYFYSGKL